jgi:DNA-binding MarR family transcriptional regulator
MKKSNFNETDKTSSGFLLWQVTTLWQREIKTALEEVNLSHSGFVLLASLLWFKEQDVVVTQTTLIEHTKLDKMTVSKSLKKLEKDAFVLRAENEADTRAKTIVLTDDGVALAMKSVMIVEEVDKRFFSVFSQQEKKQFNGLFLKLLGES